MLKKIVVPALVALGLFGASLAPAAHAQKPTPAPKMGGKMDKMGGKMDKMKPADKKGDKKTPARGKDGKFLKKSDKKTVVKKTVVKKSEKMSGDKMSGDKMVSGKPMWDAKLNRWRLNGKFIKEADALKLGGKK